MRTMIPPGATRWTRLLDFAGVIGLALTLAAFVTGTLVNFSLPYLPEEGQGGCYFADRLVAYIECPDNKEIGRLLTWAWWSTWGIPWQIVFLPFSLVTLVLELLAIGLAIRLLLRLFDRPTAISTDR